jgi:hypothetical protein
MAPSTRRLAIDHALDMDGLIRSPIDAIEDLSIMLGEMPRAGARGDARDPRRPREQGLQITTPDEEAMQHGHANPAPRGGRTCA